MASKKPGSNLSKNVLQMKFMQRSVLRKEEEQNAEERQKDIDDEHWVLDLPDTPKKEEKYIIQPSFVICENLSYGRMSYRGCNPEIEKIMASKNAENEERITKEKERETDVSDKEMARRYSTLIGIIAKKFNNKRMRNKDASKEEKTGEDGEPSKKKPPKIFPDPEKPKALNKVKKFLKPDDS